MRLALVVLSVVVGWAGLGSGQLQTADEEDDLFSVLYEIFDPNRPWYYLKGQPGLRIRITERSDSASSAHSLFLRALQIHI